MPGLHACAVPKTFQEALSIAASLLDRGLERGQPCVFVAHDNGSTVVRMALRSQIPDLEGHEAAGRLAVIDSKDTPLAGPFDAKRLYSAWAEMTNAARGEGFCGLQVVVEMTWALHLDVGALADYEKNAEPLFEKAPLDALCLYNWHAFQDTVLIAAAAKGHARYLPAANEGPDSLDELCRRLGVPR